MLNHSHCNRSLAASRPKCSTRFSMVEAKTNGPTVCLLRSSSFILDGSASEFFNDRRYTHLFCRVKKEQAWVSTKDHKAVPPKSLQADTKKGGNESPKKDDAKVAKKIAKEV